MIEATRPASPDKPTHDWPSIPLGDVGEIVSGITLGRKTNGKPTRSVPYLRVANVKDGRLDIGDIYEVEATDGEIEKLSLRHGDLLLTEGGDADKLGRGTFWEDQLPECIHQNHIFRVRFDLGRFCPRFLSAQFASPYGKSYFFAHAKQTTGIATINQRVLAAFPLLAPSLVEQRQIAELLSGQLHEVQKARIAAEVRRAAAKLLPPAYLRSVFDTPEREHWSKVRLGEVCGLRPSKSIATDGDTIVSAITTACLSESGFLPAGLKSARMWAGDAEESVVEVGEILVARSNTAELVGRAALFNGEAEGVVASDLTIRIWPGPKCHPPFLAGYLSHLYQTGYWIDRAGGASGSMKKITRSQIVELEIPLLPLADQRAISARLSRQMETAGRLRDSLDHQLAAINRLPEAILGRAFAGGNGVAP